MRFMTFTLITLLGSGLVFPYSPVFAEQGLYQSLEEKIAQQEYKQITSVLVQKDGNLLYEQYFNNGSSELLNDVRSASKSITAILFGMALEDGYFKSVEDRVLPIFKHKQPIADLFAAKKSMTFDQLLAMTSPLECNDFERASAGNEEKMYLRKDWERFILDLPEAGTPPWEAKSEDRPYGRTFRYCTGGVFMLGAAIEYASDTTLTAYADKKLFKPLDISHKRWQFSPMGIAQGGGGLGLRSRDLIKIGQLMLNGGRYGQQQLLSKAWVEAMFKPRSVAMADMNIDYGYLWWINHFEINGKDITAYAASGNGGNYVFVVPQLNLTAVITAQAYNTPYMHPQAREIMTDHILAKYVK